jgi:hypothetical protein
MVKEKIKDDILNHRGKFALDVSIMETPALWQKIMSQVLITKCEYDFSRQCFIYEGMSYLFDLIIIAPEVSPFYRLEMNGNSFEVFETTKLEVSL